MSFFDPPKLNLDKATAKFQEFWPDGHRCPICKNVDWSFAPELVELTHRARGGYTPTYPCVVVVCNVCGHSLLFNARILGLDLG